MTGPGDMPGQGQDSPLRRAVLEVEEHVAQAGWDRPPRLFALVATADLLAAQPELAGQVGDPDGYTPVEQDLPPGQQIEDLLLQIGWPAEVVGCAVSMERLMLPPEAEADLPADSAAAEAAAAHPDRQDVRIVAGSLRDGSRHATVRARTPDAPLLEGPDLVPGLADVLEGTLGD